MKNCVDFPQSLCEKSPHRSFFLYCLILTLYGILADFGLWEKPTFRNNLIFLCKLASQPAFDTFASFWHDDCFIARYVILKEQERTEVFKQLKGVNNMPNVNHFSILACAIIFIVLSIWGCDQSLEIPTSESPEASESNDLISDTEANAAPAAVAIPLNLFWNAISTDYLTIAQPKAPLGAPAQGHVFQGIIGRILPAQQAGTIPLKLFWNNIRKDYLTTTANAVPPGYVIVRIEGFIFSNLQPGTVPLKLFWNAGRLDYLTRTGAAPAGYVNVRTEGYVLP